MNRLHSPSQHPVHIVCGPPASGKTTLGRKLAEELNAVFLDSDDVCDRLVSAGMQLAGLPADDRDSAAYKQAYREPVYETLFDLAIQIQTTAPVVVAGPFTSESQSSSWPSQLKTRFGVAPVIHFVLCDPAQRKKNMRSRAAARDNEKLSDWQMHEGTSFTGPPPFPCELIYSPDY